MFSGLHFLRCDARDHSRCSYLGNFIRLALYTGCRKNELLMLEWSRVFERGCVSLGARHTKSARRRLVPLNEGALLRDQRGWSDRVFPESPWVFSANRGRRLTILRKGFDAACRRAAIDDLRIHDLRHAFASWLVMDGVSPYVVRDLLGHSSIAVTERYAHLSSDHGRRLFRGCFRCKFGPARRQWCAWCVA